MFVQFGLKDVQIKRFWKTHLDKERLRIIGYDFQNTKLNRNFAVMIVKSSMNNGSIDCKGYLINKKYFSGGLSQALANAYAAAAKSGAYKGILPDPPHTQRKVSRT